MEEDKGASLRDRATAAEPVVSALRDGIPSAVQDLAHTLEWCAEAGRIEGLHPSRVRKAAALLREQALQIADLERILAANTPTVVFRESEGDMPYTTERRITFIAAKPQAYHVRMLHDKHLPYPVEVEARRAVRMFATQFEDALLPLTAQAMETRQGEDENLASGDSLTARSQSDAPNNRQGGQ